MKEGLVITYDLQSLQENKYVAVSFHHLADTFPIKFFFKPRKTQGYIEALNENVKITVYLLSL